MKMNIICVGKKHETIFVPAIAEYENRIAKFGVKLSWFLIEHATLPEKARMAEGEKILKHVPENAFVILLDEKGEMITNQALATHIENKAAHGKDICFVIGGAYGVSDEVLERADLVVAFGKVVFPHQLVRVMLLEQIYRSMTFIRGLPYHNA